MNIVIPMAGKGSRFFNAGFMKPKPLIKVFKNSIVEHAIGSLNIEGNYIFIVRDFKNENLNRELREILESIKPNCTIIVTDRKTNGAAETCLLAKEYIHPNEELVITNCDQYLQWNSDDFLRFSRNYDGSILTYKSDNPKNSFALLTNAGRVERIAEKEVISDTALVGVHYWKKGQHFISSAEKLVEFVKGQEFESYVSLTYNYLLNSNLEIFGFDISPGKYYSLGTPHDLKKFKGIRGEFVNSKPKTIFCDIDGTILNHHHSFSEVNSRDAELLPGVLDKFDAWDTACHKIILVTARKESARKLTESQLQSLGIPYDQLIMGASSGNRVLINDKINKDCQNRSLAVNVITNEGFLDVDWEKYEL